jgi:hypothetical protein
MLAHVLIWRSAHDSEWTSTLLNPSGWANDHESHLLQHILNPEHCENVTQSAGRTTGKQS